MNIIDKGLSFGDMNYNNKPNTLIVHHIEAEGVNWTVETIHNMHKNENGWAGIGYHYYIKFDGSIYKGRPDNALGAHCQGANTNTLGITFEGNYDKRTEMPTAQFNAWCELKDYLNDRYGNMPVYGHREKGSSECPGKYFPLADVKTAKVTKDKGYVITDYLPDGYRGNNEFEGVDLEYVLSYFKGIRCYIKSNSKGVWIETQVLQMSKCLELKKTLGSWFYAIK
ncbi:MULTISPECIES: peptidoglycan recognition family protein [unclassified Clostridium]|uniref:peptidoglycan recognition protein family protein n=1 Tax=unclassified Clostridium TaxID=2614128 RepID=UPI002079488E|nr:MULTISPECIES: peptidoglycan recognition family protein [unclassified Clostridium]